ncbi:MAG: UMP kinase [Bacteroidota bacterium]|nr:UMP kinase [Bacteroidota bacterium]
MAYKRILLKLSGESLQGKGTSGIDPVKLKDYTAEILAAVKQKVQVAIVIGGGNIFRGLSGAGDGIDRVQGDYMGMLATIINGMALQDALTKAKVKAKVLSGIAVDPVCEAMSRERAIEYLENGYVVIISGGTGNPYFTTDTAAALRALEIKADAILKGTRVDGVYDDDPEKNKKAKKYSTLSFDLALQKGLKVMDMTAFALCRENNLPIIVFNINKTGNLLKILKGETVGTVVK